MADDADGDREALRRQRMRDAGIIGDDEPRVVLTGGARAYALRDFLTRNRVPFTYRDEGASDVAEARLHDGPTLRDPSLPQLADALGLLRAPSRSTYDLVVVGAGPAGLAASVYGASEGLSTAVVERFAPGGQAGSSSRIENYLGFPRGISGAELAERAREQAERFGAELLLTREVVGGAGRDGLHTVKLSDGSELAGRALVCATGVEWRTLDVEGLDELADAGVYYGAAASEAPGLEDRAVFIVGGGNSAGQAALYFADWAASVTLLVRGDSLASSLSHYLLDRIETHDRIDVWTRRELVGVDGDDWLRRIRVRDTRADASAWHDAHAVFICIGGAPHTGWAAESGMVLDERGYLCTGPDLAGDGLPDTWSVERDPYPLETSTPGLFAVGDVRHGSTKRVSTAVGEGAMVVKLVHDALVR